MRRVGAGLKPAPRTDIHRLANKRETQPMNTDAVRSYYAGIGEREWTRLENPDDGAIEFEVTCQVLAKYLPPHAGSVSV